ncbi:MAG: proline--tRNA ligase [Bacteroidetes bacterium]|nr:proline--tRNA ligase [Bacteroidota bacterium]
MFEKKNNQTEEAGTGQYSDLVVRAGLAEYSDVRGCMIIKPYGYSIWEKMQAVLDKMFKDTGHTNAYFPLFIPKSYFSREASHVEGFAKECAVVTHYRLKNTADGSGVEVDPDAKLEEELVIRPTSETIIWNSYKKWIQSYRDLPLLINQWANVVRWEMRTRLFLRTTEFLWQEGHTAHATKQEAVEEAETMLDVYARFAEDFMAMSVLKGKKTPYERFAGAEETYCIEALMLDGKGLQAGTSHFLGQNFARAFDVKFSTKEGTQDFVWATSWGVSTRLIGGLVLVHSDEKGLCLPPKLAPIQVIIVPVYKKDEEKLPVDSVCREMLLKLKEEGIDAAYDHSDTRSPGWKFSEYELKGVPLRIVVGPKDVANKTFEIVRRDTREKSFVPVQNLLSAVKDLLQKVQENLFRKSVEFREKNTTVEENYSHFREVIEERGGFILAHWDGTAETEKKIKEETKATIRLIPFGDQEPGKCIVSGNPSTGRVVFARAY